MAYKRLIIAGQLPIAMRYQEWFASELAKHLSEGFDKVEVLGRTDALPAPFGEFSTIKPTAINELNQMQQYLDLPGGYEDTVIVCDISYPGLFPSVLLVRLPKKAVGFCHATSVNYLDVFADLRDKKWPQEKANMMVLDKVFVASKYHANKLWGECSDHELPLYCLNALPNPPVAFEVPHLEQERVYRFVSTSRRSPQKVNQKVENHLEKITGAMIHNARFFDWAGYYQFLSASKFLVITASEETYGYQVVDAVLRGCIPIAPRDFSYPLLLPDVCLYEPDLNPEIEAQRIKEVADRLEANPIKIVLQNAEHIAKVYENIRRHL